VFTSLNPHTIGLTIPFTESLELASTHNFEELDLSTMWTDQLELSHEHQNTIQVQSRDNSGDRTTMYVHVTYLNRLASLAF
jgi:hypothetical protein